MGVPSLRCEKPRPTTHLLVWASSGLCRGLKFALSSLLALITGQALNSIWQQAPPLIWEVMNLMSPSIDGMASDKLSQSPPGERCHSHTLHLLLLCSLLPPQFLLSFLSQICLWKTPSPFAVCTCINYSWDVSSRCDVLDIGWDFWPNRVMKIQQYVGVLEVYSDSWATRLAVAYFWSPLDLLWNWLRCDNSWILKEKFTSLSIFIFHRFSLSSFFHDSLSGW